MHRKPQTMRSAREIDADFVHEIDIGVTRQSLHAFLCDLHNYVPLHPLIESIEEIAPPPGMPASRGFRVVDRISLGPFRLRVVYTAALESISECEVHGRAWQSPGVRVHTVYRLNDSADGTHLLESVRVEAPWPLRGFVIRQARDSHRITLDKMKRHLERGGAS